MFAHHSNGTSVKRDSICTHAKLTSLWTLFNGLQYAGRVVGGTPQGRQVKGRIPTVMTDHADPAVFTIRRQPTVWRTRGGMLVAPRRASSPIVPSTDVQAVNDMQDDDNVILCPPDKLVLVDYLQFKTTLEREIARADADTLLPVFQQLLHLLENVTHTQYVQTSRHIKSSMTVLRPLLSHDEHEVGPGPVVPATAVTQAAEQHLLDTMMDLLLESRYSPLTAQQWDIAQNSEFTFGELHSSQQQHMIATLSSVS